MTRSCRTLWALSILALIAGSSVSAEDVPVTFSWDAPGVPAHEYRLYRSTTPGQYGAPLAVIAGQQTRYGSIIAQTDRETTYYHVLTAVDLAGKESLRSNEVVRRIPALPIVALPIPTPALSLVPLSSTSLQITWPPLGPDYGIDIRMMPAPMRWGEAPSVSCATSPCTIDGLTPGTTYEAVALAYTGTLNVNAKFGPFGAPASANTLPLADPLPAPPKGLIISESSPSEIVVTASVADCPSIDTSTKGSTATVLKRTVRCLQE